MRRGLYLHIPFCRSKCAYCDFPSFAGCEGQMEAVVDGMCRQMRQEVSRLDQKRLSTLYIGGGTPSLLPFGLMDRLLSAAEECFLFEENAEISCEMNPGTVTAEFLDVLKAHGVNRLSIGVQCAQDRLLKMLGRIHTFAQACETVALCREKGFSNINLDLMLGLPSQSMQDALQTAEQFLALEPKHLSCYGLIVEEGTLLQRKLAKGEWTLPDADESANQYDGVRRALEEAGFKRYEISNFARQGYACRHNMDCWKRQEYIGIGVSACGFIGNVRYQNPCTIEAYLAQAPRTEELISPQDARFESVMLGLRMTEGIGESEFISMHGMGFEQAFGGVLHALQKEGLLVMEDGRMRLTDRGMDVQNSVLVRLME